MPLVTRSSRIRLLRSSPLRAGRRLVSSIAVVLVMVQATAPSVLAVDCWAPPVQAPVTDPFREPACAWCPGNRGLEYGTGPGDRVTAVASGEVTFAGSVAGTTYVVVRHADGLRVTYGNLSDVTLRVGDVVARGAVVGRADGAVHLGVRDGDRYLDPAPFIGELRGVVRLVPTDGSPPAPAPPPRLLCDAARR